MKKRFYPFGGDQQVSSDFQLIALAVRDLRQRGGGGTFTRTCTRAVIWTLELPGLRQREEDIEPNARRLRTGTPRWRWQRAF